MKKNNLSSAPPADLLTRRAACKSLGLLAGALSLPPMIASRARAEHPRAELQKIADGIFVHVGGHELPNSNNHGDTSNAGFIIGDEAVAVIDTGGSYLAGTALRDTIKAKTSKPIRYVINTHMHPDHVLGNSAFKSDQPRFIAHGKMARALQARGARYLETAQDAMGQEAFRGTEIVLPTEGVSDVTTLDLGGRKLKLVAMPTAHTDNDLVVIDEKTQTAFVGDLVFSGHVPALDGSILGWVQVLQNLGEKPPKLIVPGHGPASMGWQEATKPMLRYLSAVIDDIREIIASGGTMSDAISAAAVREAPHWELFSEFHKRNVTAAFAELEWE